LRAGNFSHFGPDGVEIRSAESPRMLERGQMVFISDLVSSRRFQPLLSLCLGEGIDSLWWIPLYDGETATTGALLYGLSSKHELSPDDRTIASLFSSHLGTALRQQQLLDQLVAKTEESVALLEINRRSLEELSLIQRVSQEAFSTSDIDELLEKLVEVMCESFSACCGAAFLVDQPGRLRQKAAYSRHTDGKSRMAEDLTMSTPRLLAGGAESRYVPDVSKEPALRGLLAEGGSVLICPLKRRSQIVGLLAVANPARDYYLSRDLLDALCAQMSQGIVDCYAHEGMLRERAKLELLFEQSTDGFLVLDPEGRVTSWNKAAGRLLRRSGYEVQGRKCCEVLRCASADDGLICRRVGRSGKLSDSDCILNTDRPVVEVEWPNSGDKDGVEVSLSVVPIAPALGVEGLTMVVLRDVSQRKEIERLKAEFISAVSHELRTSLTSVKAYVSTIMDLGDDISKEENTRYLRGISKATDRLSRLAEDLLNVSRIEQGRLFLDRGPSSMEDLLLSVVDEMQGRYNSHVIRLKMDKPLPDLNMDVEKMEQVILNLVHNAVRYSPKALKIEVVARLVKEVEALEATWDPELGSLPQVPLPCVSVSVRDWGIGIAKEQQAQLFTKFYRVPNKVRVAGTSVGLGLYICKGMVEAHGGAIWVKSRQGRGSRFTFCLPIESP